MNGILPMFRITAPPVFMPIGRALFALGIVAFGIQHILWQEFIAGRAPAWPEALPGEQAWAIVSGMVLILAGSAIGSGRGGRGIALAAAAMVLIWGFVRHLPLVAIDMVFGGQWTAAGKALVVFSGLVAFAPVPRTTGDEVAPPGPPAAPSAATHLARFALALFLALCGLQHFLFSDFVATLLPAGMPAPYFWTYFAGIALILGGIGMMLPRTAPLAAGLSGVMVFSWVWIVHLPRSLSGASPYEWTSFFEALAFAGLALYLAAALTQPQPSAVTRRSEPVAPSLPV